MPIKCAFCHETVTAWCTTDTARGPRLLCTSHRQEVERERYSASLENLAGNALLLDIIATSKGR